MKPMAKRLISLTLAGCLLGSAAALPASAAPWTQPAGGVLETLLEVPILGDLLRLITGDEAESTGETAALGMLTAATPETSTPESSTPESATPETATPESTISWPDSWMVGSAAPGGLYPAGDPDAARSLTVPTTLWSSVELETGTLDAACREETNFGDLAADAISYATAASNAWQRDPLPLVSVLDGRRLLKSVPAGTVLEEGNLGEYLTDDSIALAVVTPQKLQYILAEAMQAMLDTGSEQYGDFLQVSGLRFTYQTTNGSIQLKNLWLAGPDGEIALDLQDNSTRIALALPTTLYQSYTSDSNNLLADAGLTLHGALLDLAKNCDADTLKTMLQRGGTSGRILPDGAESFTAYLKTDGSITNASATVYVDGASVQVKLDKTGTLVIDNLAPGGHTVTLVPGGTAYYVSSLLDVGTDNQALQPVVALPEEFVTTPLTTPTPTPKPTATAKPSATPKPAATTAPAQSQQNTITVTATATPSPTPVPTPIVTPAPVSTPASHATAKPSSDSGVKDPTAGTIIGVTPAPTLEPTPTPKPTPTPTPDPEEEEQVQQMQETSSMLPLYVGIGLLVVCAVIIAVVVIRRRLEDGQGNHYRRH